jgi:hypothetical protein
MPLQRIRRHAGFCQELRGSRGRRKPLDPVAAPFGLGANGGERGCFARTSDAFERDEAVVTAKDLENSRALKIGTVILRSLFHAHFYWRK